MNAPNPSIVARRSRRRTAGLILMTAMLATACDAGRAGSATADAGVVHLTTLLDAARYTNPDMPDVAPTVGHEGRGGDFRQTLRVPAPGRLEFDLRLPPAARFDAALATDRGGDRTPVEFTVTIEADGESTTLVEESVRPRGRWVMVSADLEAWAGRTVTLVLAADSASGSEAWWAAPTISGAAPSDRPNVILYIIDAAGAEYMSVYDYNRATTPNIARLAAEGVVFERAYSNSSWTKLSTPSFLSSLHSSALGGYRESHDRIPDGAVPVAERLQGAGYGTALLTANPFAGTMTGLERGVDILRQTRAEPISVSSPGLHDEFHRWRREFPGGPWYVHFQTTDVHWPWTPPDPFAGLYVDPATRELFYRQEEALAAAAGLARPQWLHGWRYPDSAFAATGIDRTEFFAAARGLYDETMAHNDHQIGRLVASLRASGEWENTVLIIASDHGSAHGLGLFDPVPERSGPIFNPYRTRIPLIVIAPGRIEGGQRVDTPVSMIDVAPTILDLAGLPQPDVRQGQSLLPLMGGAGTWDPRPVVLDEFYVDTTTDELSGWIELIDGRWGASLYVEPENADPPYRDTPLLLYDLLLDPYCLRSVHEEHPELAAAYRTRLEELLAAHRALAATVGPAGATELTTEQLEALRTLGYIE